MPSASPAVPPALRPATAQLQLSARPAAVVGARTIELALPDALLLAWLALEGATPRERLAGLLWPGNTPEAARNALRQRLFRLRRQTGVELVQGSTVLELAAGVAHDLLGADNLPRNGLLGSLRAVDLPEADTWLQARRAQQRQQAQQALTSRIQALEAAGDPAAALPLALALLQAEPLSEDAHRRVMRLHYLRGDRAAAMLAFDHCEQQLKHEVGTAPSRQTLALLATIERSAPLADAGAVAASVAIARQALPAAVLRPPRLVGRDAELAALQRGLNAGQVVVLVGEAGMGKSRLLQALAAARPGVLHASGRPGDSLVPYATLARTLRQLLERQPGVADAALRQALSPLLPELAEPDATLRPQLQPPLAQPVLTLLQRIAGVDGGASRLDVLALDDLHFADDATLELLQALLSAPRDASSLQAQAQAPAHPPIPPSQQQLAAQPAPALAPEPAPALRWCLGLRPAAAGSQLRALLDALATAGPHLRLHLQALTEPQMAEFVDSLALPGVAGADIAATLCQRSGGNPLFALETLKLAWSEGKLGGAAAAGGDVAPDAGGRQLASAAALPRPDSLAQLIAQQLARLSPAALQLARVAAVGGVDFNIALAETLLGRPALELADAWAELEAQQVLRGEAFAHDLVHESVLQGLPQVIARHLHGQTAAWLETRQGQDGAPTRQGQDGAPARVAAHWEAAGQHTRALPALRAAAQHAHRALREGERFALLLHAADIAQADGRQDEAFALVRSTVQGHMDTVRQADGLPLLDRLQALARTPWQHASVAADRFWYATVLGDFGAAIGLGERAWQQAQPLGDDGLVASIRQRLGTALSMVGRFDEALPHMHAAAAWIDAEAPADERCAFHGNLAVVLDNLGRPADGQAHHLRALALTLAQNDPSQHATQLANHAANRLDMGDVHGASAQAEQAQRIVSTYELAGSSAGFIATLQAQCHRTTGRYASALQWCDQAEAILAQRNPARVPLARLQQAHVWLDLGQHARALQLLGGPALDAARAMPARYAVRWLVLLARVQRRLGPAAQAQATSLLAEAAQLAPSNGWPELGLMVRTEQALALPPEQGCAGLRAVAADAAQRQLHGAELGALLHATLLAARVPSADTQDLAHRALQLAQTTEAPQADRALRWLAPAQALAATGANTQAAALAAEGQAWLRHIAAHHVAPAFVTGFLHQHPVNAALLAR